MPHRPRPGSPKICALLCALAGASVVLPARAAGPSGASPKVAVAGIDWQGDPQPDAEALMADNVAAALADGQWSVVDAEAVAEAADCSDTACVADVGRAAAVDYVLVPRVRLQDRVYELELELVDVARGKVVTTATDTCQICSVDEAGTRMSSVAGELSAPPADGPRGAASGTTLAVASGPAGATVLVDDRVVGQTPYRADVTPGPHVVRVQLPGRYPHRAEVVAVDGKEVTVDAALRRDRRPALLGAGIGAVAVGMGMVGAGGPLIAIDTPGRRARSDYETLSAGIALVTTGGVLVGGGIAMVVLGARKSPTQTAVARRHSLHFGLGPRGASVAGRF